jgi:hypothetical protein
MLRSSSKCRGLAGLFSVLPGWLRSGAIMCDRRSAMMVHISGLGGGTA